MKLRFVFSLALAIGSVPGILEADIVANTFCSLAVGGNGVGGSNGPNYCVYVYNSPQTSGLSVAFSSGRLLTFTAPPGSGSPVSDIELDFSADAYSSLLGPPLAGEATATGNSAFTLTTDGPVRPGTLVYDENVTLLGGPFSVGPFSADINQAQITVGSLSTTCMAQGEGPSPLCTGFGPANGSASSGNLPVTLGQSFSLAETWDIATQSEATPSLYHVEAGHANVTFSFYILDANGASVPIFVTPEPSCFALLGAGLVLLAALQLRHKVGSIS